MVRDSYFRHDMDFNPQAEQIIRALTLDVGPVRKTFFSKLYSLQ